MCLDLYLVSRLDIRVFNTPLQVANVAVKYCTFDPNWQPGPWISRISCSSQSDYCSAGQKHKKSHWGHGSAMIIGWDRLGHSLVHFTYVSFMCVLFVK